MSKDKTTLDIITKAFDDYAKRHIECCHCVYSFEGEPNNAECAKCCDGSVFICDFNTQQFKEYLAKKLEGKC